MKHFLDLSQEERDQIWDSLNAGDEMPPGFGDDHPGYDIPPPCGRHIMCIRQDHENDHHVFIGGTNIIDCVGPVFKYNGLVVECVTNASGKAVMKMRFEL